MHPRILIALVLATVPAAPADMIADALARLSEEAEVFGQIAPQVLSQETCRQKAAQVRRGLHFGAAPPPGTPPQFSFRVREITSEYGFAALQDAAKDALYEFRRVISVDGRPIETATEARRKLSLALKDPGDRERRRLLREFERWGLDGAVTDFGQSILLFVRRKLADYQFTPGESGRIGPDQAHAINFRQSGGAQAFRFFDRGDQVVHQPLEGRIWFRDSDSLPLRIELRSARKQKNSSTIDVAVIDYAMSTHGALLPASVLYRQYVGEHMVVENSLQYSTFRRFAASAEIKFTEIDEALPKN